MVEAARAVLFLAMAISLYALSPFSLRWFNLFTFAGAFKVAFTPPPNADWSAPYLLWNVVFLAMAAMAVREAWTCLARQMQEHEEIRYVFLASLSFGIFAGSQFHERLPGRLLYALRDSANAGFFGILLVLLLYCLLGRPFPSCRYSRTHVALLTLWFGSHVCARVVGNYTYQRTAMIFTVAGILIYSGWIVLGIIYRSSGAETLPSQADACCSDRE